MSSMSRIERIALVVLAVLTAASIGSLWFGSIWFYTSGLLVAVMWAFYLASVVEGVFKRPVAEPGYCRKCGYDLTGNVNEVCPECGKFN